MTSLSLHMPYKGRQRLFTKYVFIVASLILVVRGQEETNDIQTLLNDELPAVTDTNWNLPDTKASVGKLFQYDLGLKKQPGKYQIKEISHEALPNWLTYNPVADQLEGVPSIDDIGEHNIALVPEEPQSGMVKHFFTVVVSGDRSQQLLYSPMTERTKIWENCRSDDPVTMAKIILDADMASLTGTDRAKILNSIINHLTVGSDFLRLHPLGDEPAYDKTALVAGPGNAQERQKLGVVLSWQIGCGSVDAENMAILEKVESSARDGTMADVIGHPIVGWSVTNNRLQTVQLSRKKRAVQPTQALEASLPTKVTDEKSNPDDYFGETEDGFSRNIPIMASPRQTRHSKRTKTAGRHMHKKSRNPGHKKYKSPMATQSMTPIVPTAHVKFTSTVVGVEVKPSKSKSMYTTPSPEQPISRTAVPIQPSMPSERPVTTTSYTPPLPTPFYTQFPSMPSTSRPTISSTRTEIKPSTSSSSKEAIKPSKRPVVPVSPEPEKNKTPAPNKRALKRIDGNFGRVLNVKIPIDLFHDEEDGDTRKLKLMLLKDQMNVPRAHWLQLKEKQQVLQGVLLPPKPSRGRPPRKLEFNYEIAAIDSGGKIARTPLQVVMKRLPHINKINHEFMITIDFDYNIFKDNVMNSVTVVNKIAKLYGDNNTNNIVITSLKPGSVMFAWTNTSIEMAPCPALEIKRLLSYIITEEKTLTQNFVDIMRHYRIKTAGARALGACNGYNFKVKGKDNVGTVFVRNNDGNTPYDVSPETGQSEEEKKSRETSEDNLLITTVVPAVVIAAMILLAAIIACVLYRKKRKGKMSLDDKHTFVNKGIPVIFADELEDKPDPPTKPLIMPEEKPPLPPPEYHRSGSIPPSPPSDHKDPIESTEDERDYDDRDNSPPYQPPPPFMSGNVDHRQQRPRQVQMHRSPPPYVPP